MPFQKGNKLAAKKAPNRTERVPLMMTKGDKRSLEAAAKRAGVSRNEAINQAIADYITKN